MVDPKLSFHRIRCGEDEIRRICSWTWSWKGKGVGDKMDIGTGCGTSPPKEDLGGEIPEEKGEVDIAQVAKKVRIENVAAIDGKVATPRQEGCIGDNNEKKMPAVDHCVGCLAGACSQGNDGCETPWWVRTLNFSVQLKDDDEYLTSRLVIEEDEDHATLAIKLRSRKSGTGNDWEQRYKNEVVTLIFSRLLTTYCSLVGAPIDSNSFLAARL